MRMYPLVFLVIAFYFGCLTPIYTQEVRVSQAAMLMQSVGNAQITFSYSRPGVKNRKIWGALVPYGLSKSDEGKMIPWRAGANENTTFTVTKNVKIEGQTLKAGTYGLHMIPGTDAFTIIFSKNSTAWGSFSYDPSEDVLRVNVKPESAVHQEWLLYGFDSLTEHSCTAFLHWERLKIPIKIEL